MKHLVREDDVLTFFCDACEHVEEEPHDGTVPSVNAAMVKMLHASIAHGCAPGDGGTGGTVPQGDAGGG